MTKGKNVRKVLVLAIALTLVLGNFLGNSLVSQAGSGNVMGVPFSLAINKDSTSAQTIPNQSINEEKNAGDTSKIRQIIANAPVETGGSFHFNSEFSMKQSTRVMGFVELWGALVKPSQADIQNFPTQRGATSMSYVDLVVDIDSRITINGEYIEKVYFDSHTWRPIYVLDENYTVIKDLRDTYVAGNSRKEFDVPARHKFIIRVAPIGGVSFTDAQKDAPMTFGFDTPGTNNFSVSDEMANSLADARRNMSQEDIQREKDLIDKANVTPTAEEISFLRKYNLYTGGSIEGHVIGNVRFLGRIPMSVTNQVPPAGIAVSYSNPYVEFMNNYMEDDTQTKDVNEALIQRVYVEYKKTIPEDALVDQSIPADPIREGYEFVGWSNTPDATRETLAEHAFNPNEEISRNKVVYAIWEKIPEKGKIVANYVDKSGRQLEQPVEKVEVAGTKVDVNTLAKSDIVGYSLVEHRPNVDSLTVEANQTQEVTFIYDKKTKEIQVTYVDEAKKVIASSTTLTAKYGDDVEVNTLIKDISNYTYVRYERNPVDEVNSTKTHIRIDDEITDITLVYQLKDAKVKYEFESATQDKALPQSVLDLTPEQEDVKFTDEVEPTQPTQRQVVVEDGVWTFDGYTPSELTVDEEVETFVGRWTFEKKMVNVSYVFESATSGVPLSEDIKNKYTPSAETYEYGTKVWASLPREERIDVADGRWTFIGYIEDSKVVTEDTTFIGQWTFEKRAAVVKYTFESQTPNEVLPTTVLAQLPEDENVLFGDEVTPTNPMMDSVEVEKGRWVFKGYVPTHFVVDEPVELVVGQWALEIKDVRIKHIFESDVQSPSQLPQEVLNLLPEDKVVKYGSNESATEPIKTRVAVEGGTWIFEGYQNSPRVLREDMNTFTGLWRFEQAPATTDYEFVSETLGKVLPREVLALLPQGGTTSYGSNVRATEPAKSFVEVADGTWNFVGYQDSPRIVDEAVEKFIGSWRFTAKVARIEYQFIAENNTLSLPAQVLNLLPTGSQANFGDNIQAIPPMNNQVEVEEGVWTFVGYGEPVRVVDEDVESFVGVWQFTPKVVEPKTYYVDFRFVSASAMPLPQEVLSQQPTQLVNQEDQKNVVAPTDFREVRTLEGIWTFKSWDQNSKTINGADITFIGTWEYKAHPKNYMVSYVFRIQDNPNVPIEVAKIKPVDDMTYLEGTVVQPQTLRESKVVVDQVTYTFLGWDKSSATLHSDVTFVGYWSAERVGEPLKVDMPILPMKEEIVTEEKVLDFTTKYVDDPNLEEGKEVVLQEGMLGGTKLVKKLYKLEDDRVLQEMVIESSETSPIEKIIARGTKKIVDEQPNQPKKEEPIQPSKKEETKKPLPKKESLKKPKTKVAPKTGDISFGGAISGLALSGLAVVVAKRRKEG